VVAIGGGRGDWRARTNTVGCWLLGASARAGSIGRKREKSRFVAFAGYSVAVTPPRLLYVALLSSHLRTLWIGSSVGRHGIYINAQTRPYVFLCISEFGHWKLTCVSFGFFYYLFRY
jgi:hypothetical protein